MRPLTWQATLLDQVAPRVDEDFNAIERIALDTRSWVDYQPAWLAGADQVFSELMASAPWVQRQRRIFDRDVDEPRLTAQHHSGDAWFPAVLERARQSLSARYGVEFDSVGFNLYRAGSDSVAWHRDRIPKEISDPLVALVSLGEPRSFRLRPYGGGRSQVFLLGRGDLLVTGGRTQRQWEHSVPKVARAGPRISVAYRHGRPA
jgi:alkylated DNA repair dioxygenase AlkB